MQRVKKQIATAATLAAVGVLLLPEVAHASSDGEPSSSSTAVIVTLLVLVSVAYLAAHFAFDWLQKTFLVMAGVEFLLLGVLLGPQLPVLHLTVFEHPQELLPIVALAVGGVGLLRGMELSVKDLFTPSAQAPVGTLMVVVVQALVAGGASSLLAYTAFTQGWFVPYGENGVSESEAWMAAGVLGCAAAAGSAGPIELLKRRYRLEGDVQARIRRMAAMSDLLAIVVFGLLFCVFHRSGSGAQISLGASDWAFVTVGLGILLGLLFTPFLGDDDSENGRFLAMVGIIVLASGAAYFLALSPLFVNLCLGAVLVNTAKTGAKIRATLERTKRPMMLVLLIFAGALTNFDVDPANAVLVCIAYVVVRLMGKWIGTKLAAWRQPFRGDYYRGLLAHGEVSVAMAVSLRLVYEGPAIDLAYMAILASYIVNDLIAPRVLRGLLVDTGDLRGERKEEPV